jgi:hypothetical protein
MFLAWLKRREIVQKQQAQQVAAPSDKVLRLQSKYWVKWISGCSGLLHLDK